MITIHNLLTNEVYYGDVLEFYIDDDTLIGEVYLDGDLIYQLIDEPSHDEYHLQLEFSRIFEIRESVIDNDAEYSDDYLDDFE